MLTGQKDKNATKNDERSFSAWTFAICAGHSFEIVLPYSIIDQSCARVQLNLAESAKVTKALIKVKSVYSADWRITKENA